MIALQLLAKRLTRVIGLRVERIPRSSQLALDPDKTYDPIVYEYMPRLRGSGRVDASLADARGFHSLGLPLQEVHPFVRAAKAAQSSESEAQMDSIIRDVLASYYEAVQPRSALEVVGVDEQEAPGLAGRNADTSLFPWESKSFEGIVLGRDRAMRLDSVQYGKALSRAHGLTAFGPVSSEKLELEVKRVRRLVSSISKTGYVQTRTAPIKVTALRSDSGYRWLIGEGSHRAAVCAALSIPSLPAEVSNVVRREDYAQWPQVLAGVYTPEGALSYFDRLFDGVPPQVCKSW